MLGSHKIMQIVFTLKSRLTLSCLKIIILFCVILLFPQRIFGQSLKQIPGQSCINCLEEQGNDVRACEFDEDLDEHSHRALQVISLSSARNMIPAIINSLQSKEVKVCINLIGLLQRMGTKAAPQIVPALIQKVHDEEPSVRSEACYALGFMGSEGLKAVPDLIATLDDSHTSVRKMAIFTLTILNPINEYEYIIPKVVKALQDSPTLKFFLAQQGCLMRA